MKYTDSEKKEFDRVAGCVRALTLEAIEKAQSGHPGLPLGCAELGTLLYTDLLQHNPIDPNWKNRDRFVLSGGHGSMLLYSLLHLSGYDLSIDDIKAFRSLGSKTPGHPEYGETPGVETTTGPLGQGLATSVGMAIAQKRDQAIWPAFDNRVVVLAGDGDMMEGVVHEAVSLAGMQQLNNLIVIYDKNNITIDGNIDITFTENTRERFEACGWTVLTCSGYDYDDIRDKYDQAKASTDKPVLIIAQTLIGKGAPDFEDQPKAHSGAMGQAQIDHIRKVAGLSAEAFSVPEEVYEYFAEKRIGWKQKAEEWNTINQEILDEMDEIGDMNDYAFAKELIEAISVGDQIESRTAFSKYFEHIQLNNRNFIGGTADLNGPCLKEMKTFDTFVPENPAGNFLNYGVREHGMAAISNGIQLYDLKNKVYCSTFLSFVDYLRPSLRLSALMNIPVIYNLAYDSVYTGEDGPTHQPVEQLASIRCMPNVSVIRPGDAQEGVVCAEMVIANTDGPVCCITTRQKLNCFAKDDLDWAQNMRDKGAYIVRNESEDLQAIVVASGSEVNTALEAVEQLDNNQNIRVVSMPCREKFYRLETDLREEIVPMDVQAVVVEAAAEQGWSELSNQKVHFIGVSEFGTSAPGDIVAKARGMDPSAVSKKLQGLIGIVN